MDVLRRNEAQLIEAHEGELFSAAFSLSIFSAAPEHVRAATVCMVHEGTGNLCSI